MSLNHFLIYFSVTFAEADVTASGVLNVKVECRLRTELYQWFPGVFFFNGFSLWLASIKCFTDIYTSTFLFGKHFRSQSTIQLAKFSPSSFDK